MANATSQSSTVPTASTTPLSTASTAVASITTVKAPITTFDFAFYEMAGYGAARFSTHMGHSARRSIPRSADDRPCPIARSDPCKGVREKVETLEKQYPDFVRRIKEPRAYRDLYEYFDGYDLWVEGVQFCWHVIATIGNKNAFINRLAVAEIDVYAAQWVKYHEDRVICHPHKSDLTELFNIDELVGLDQLLPGQFATLKAKLLVYGERLWNDFCKNGPKCETRPPRLYPVPEGHSPAVSAMHPHDTLTRELTVQHDLSDSADSLKSAACVAHGWHLRQISRPTAPNHLAESTTWGIGCGSSERYNDIVPEQLGVSC
jgi:hypothetical protein